MFNEVQYNLVLGNLNNYLWSGSRDHSYTSIINSLTSYHTHTCLLSICKLYISSFNVIDVLYFHQLRWNRFLFLNMRIHMEKVKLYLDAIQRNHLRLFVLFKIINVIIIIALFWINYTYIKKKLRNSVKREIRIILKDEITHN